MPSEKGVYITDPPQAVLKIQRGRRSDGALDEVTVLQQLQQRREVLGLADHRYRIAFPMFFGSARLHTHTDAEKHTKVCEHNVLLEDLARGKCTVDPQAMVISFQGVPLVNLRTVVRGYERLRRDKLLSRVSLIPTP